MTCIDLVLCRTYTACYYSCELKKLPSQILTVFEKVLTQILRYSLCPRMVLKSVHENMERVAPEKAGKKFVVKEHKCAQGAYVY